tara:strand:+ start:217 stop:897 length:681 start_codon:yes stop_codon:yes gene_type:complete
MKYERGSFIVVPSREKLRGMPVPAQALYMWLCAYANETGECFPARSTLARDCDCSLNTVDRMTQLLVDRGLLEVSKRIKNGENMTNLYTVVIWGGSPTGEQPSPTDRQGVAPQIDKELNPVLTQTTVSGDKLRVETFSLKEDEAERPQKITNAGYESLLKWAESTHGRRFTARTKQYGALKSAKAAGLKSADLKDRWEDMESDDFWGKKGFDWTHVVSSFDRKPAV